MRWALSNKRVVLFLQQYLKVGKIINTHGINGEVKIMPLTDDPRRFYELKWTFIEKCNSMEKYDIEKVRISGNTVILKFKEVNNMNEAEALKGLFIKIDRKYAVKLPNDTFFISDILGCKVYDKTSDDELGILEDIIETGSNDVYVVKSENGKEILLPALKSVVKKVSIEDKKIWVLLPEGLIDDDI